MNFRLKFSCDGKNYTYSFEHTKAPDFCAVHYLHDFDVQLQSLKATPKPEWWRERVDGKWHGDAPEPFGAMTMEDAAVAAIKQALSNDRGTKLLLCDTLKGDISQQIVKFLNDGQQIKSEGRTYTVEIGEPYKNYNTMNMVQECCIRRVK